VILDFATCRLQQDSRSMERGSIDPGFPDLSRDQRT
jgi:hypothetical protein